MHFHAEWALFLLTPPGASNEHERAARFRIELEKKLAGFRKPINNWLFRTSGGRIEFDDLLPKVVDGCLQRFGVVANSFYAFPPQFARDQFRSARTALLRQWEREKADEAVSGGESADVEYDYGGVIDLCEAVGWTREEFSVIAHWLYTYSPAAELDVAIELRTQLRETLKKAGWLSGDKLASSAASDRASNRVARYTTSEPGLLNQIVDQLHDQLKSELKQRQANGPASAIIANLRRFAENAVYLAACSEDDLGGTLEAWNVDQNPTAMSPRRTRWRNDDWLYWRASLAAVCLSNLRRELNAGDSSLTNDSPGPDKKLCLAWAQLWEILAPSAELGSNDSRALSLYWIPPQFLPSQESCEAALNRDEASLDLAATTELPLALKFVLAMGQWEHRSYSVWFPTVTASGDRRNDPNDKLNYNSASEQDDASLGCVLNATVTLFQRPHAGVESPLVDLDSAAPADTAIFAPWSPVLITEATRQLLATRVPAMQRALKSGQIQGKVEHIMLDLTPVSGSLVLTLNREGLSAPVAVGGQSLEVSILLALWAASESLVLYPLVATGMFDGEVFSEVHGVPDKLSVIASLFQTGPCPRVLLVGQNFEEVRPRLVFDRTIDGVQKGRLEDRLDIYCLPKNLEELKKLKHLLLTDGFDEYRKFMSEAARLRDMALPISATDRDEPGVYLTEDQDELNRAIELASLVNGRVKFRQELNEVENATDKLNENHVTVLPFDNDPRLAMRYVTARLFSKVGRSPSEPVPAPLCLNTLARGTHDRRSVWDDWLDAILQGFSDLRSSDTMWSTDRRVLRVILQSKDWSKFCFVAYAPRSLECDLDQLTDAIRMLRQEIQPSRGGDSVRTPPSLLWIASDEHQARWLNVAWTQGGAAPFAVA
jgi:hypothetical protein